MEELPKPKYDQALAELEAFKSQPIPRTKKDLSSKNSTQYYLEHRLNQIRNKVEAEQKTYDLACKECEIAWNDFRDLFYGYNLFERLFSPSKTSDIRLLRKLFLEASQKVHLEKEKFGARSRVRAHEENNINEREAEIERKTSEKKLSKIKLPSPEVPLRSTKPDSADEKEISLDSVIVQDEEDIPLLDPKMDFNSLTTHSLETPNENISHKNHFGQADFLALHPNFEGMTYIDESLSLVDLDMPVITDAIFNNSFFVSVFFTNRHQYLNCSFIGTDFSHSVWHQSKAPHRIVNCDLSQSIFSGAVLNYLAFYNCRFFQTIFLGIQLNKVKFVNCTFDQCSLKGVDFSRSVMSKDMLETIDFSECLNVPNNHSTSQDNKNNENDEA